MPLGKRQRKLLLVLCLGLTAIILLLVSLPLWFPWLLRPIAAHFGVHYSHYQREGYRHLAFQQVYFTNRNVRLSVERIDMLVPTVWIWRYTQRKVPTHEPFASLNNWKLEIFPVTSDGSSAHPSIKAVAGQVAAILKQIQIWVPNAALSGGTIRVVETAIDLPSVNWSAGDLAVHGASVRVPAINRILRNSPEPLNGLNLTAGLGRPPPWEVKLGSDAQHVNSTIRISLNAAGLSVQGAASWWSNQFTLKAQFGGTRLLPDNAMLQAQDFVLPGSLFELKEYPQINGSLAAQWDGNQCVVDLNAAALPRPAETNLPPVKLDLHGYLLTNSAVVHVADVSLPWLQAKLAHDLKISFNERFLQEPAQVTVHLDLARQPWWKLQGVVDGEVLLSPGEAKYPMARFRLAGSSIGNDDLKIASLKTEGSFAWPSLEIFQIEAAFDDGSRATAQGKADLEKKEIEDGRLQAKGGLARRWLPSGYSYTNLNLTGSVSGPFTSMRHNGHLEVTGFTTPELQPLQFQADWVGAQMNLQRATARISAGASSLSVQAGLTMDGAGTNITLSALTLTTSNQDLLTLATPSVISIGRPAAQTNQWIVRVSSFDLRGSAGEICAEAGVNWPISGTASASIRNFRSATFDDFLTSRTDPFEIRSLTAAAGWTNAPLIFTIDASASLKPRKDLPLTAQISARGDASGIIISNLLVSSQTASVAVAHGALPISFEPSASTNRLRVNTESPFNFTASTEPQSVFWQKVADWTDLAMVAPNLRLGISGTLKEPQGAINFQAAQLKLRNAATNIPAFDDLDITIQLDHQIARVSRGQFLVQGQPVRFNAEMPLGQAFWSRETKLPDWRTARGHLVIEKAEMAALMPIYPELLAPQGDLSVELNLEPGPKFAGNVTVNHARTRPIPSVGAIRDIDVKLILTQDIIHLESASANLGGAVVILTGEANLQNMDWLQLAVPPFKFVLRGTNVPLSRQPEAIIRSDLDLTFTKTNDSPALISGNARLRDSFFLHDLADLVPGRVASPALRPPYFSIEIEPLAAWRLAVHVNGERFLKVRSPLFSGEVSANFDLQGTLKEPLALGDVRVNSGYVGFPFANLKVQQGFVTLASQQPYRPQLLITAASKQYGYDLKMEVTGPADAPILQFSSTPPLSSEQILLMITAGELPRDERSLTTQQRAQTLALFVGKDLLARLGFSDEKEQRLTIHSGEQLSDQGRPTYSVEYELTHRWSLVGEYDRFNAFNAGLKWRVYSK